MKNLMNKVLVVLTVSAVFAGGIDARVTPGRKGGKKPSVTMQETNKIGSMESFNRILQMGERNFQAYPRSLRDLDLEFFTKNSTNEKDIEAVRAFLLGGSKSERSKHKNAAKNAVNNALSNSANEQIEVTKNAKDEALANPNPETVKNAEAQASMLSKMYSYLPSKEQAAAGTAIGLTVAAIASLGYDLYSGKDLGTTGGATLGAAYEGVKAVPGAIYDGSNWVVNKAREFPGATMGLLGAVRAKASSMYYGDEPTEEQMAKQRELQAQEDIAKKKAEEKKGWFR